MILSISNKLKELRNIMGMNQQEFAQFLNIKQPTLSAYERDISNPSLDVLLQISDKCNVSMDWLCGQDNASHFYTGADIVKFFLELKKLKYLDYSIDFIEMDIATPNCVDSVPAVKLTFDDKNISSCDSITFNNILFSKFMRDYKELEEKLEALDDNQLKDNYMKMWLEQQLQHYSTYIIDRKNNPIDFSKGTKSIQ